MPVRVNMPIRLRVQAHSFDTRLDDVGDAVEAALKRALATSRKAVLEPRGGYVVPRLRSPTFRWTGHSDGVAANLRAALETRIAGAIDVAAKRAGVFMYARAAEDAAEVLPDEIFEPVDPNRFYEDLGLYWLPSYQKGGTKTQPTRVKTKPKVPPAPPTEQPTYAAQFYEFEDENSDDFWTALGWRVSEHFGEGRVPHVFGIIYRLAGEQALQLGILEQSRGRVTKWLAYRFPLTLAPLAGTPRRALAIDEFGAFKWIKEESAAKALETWRANYRKHLAQSLGKDLRTKRGTEAEVLKAIEDKARQMEAEYTTGWETSRPQFYTLHHPGGTATYPIAQWRVAQMPPSGYADIVPLADKVEVTDDATAKAKGPGGRYKIARGEIPGNGPGTGPGIIAREYDPLARSRFPFGPPHQTDLEKMYHIQPQLFRPECKPYMGEPSVFDMGNGGAELWAMIQKIATLLEMEPCPYVANFAINAAKVLGGRAAGVGSVVSTDNAAFLEDLSVGEIEAGELVFKPIPAPALQHLRGLAGLVPLFDELYALIVKTLYPISDLLPTGYFYNDFNEALESAIVWIYLYTCQIVLLQQLAASRENILQRAEQKNFDAYVQLTQILISTVVSDQLELLRLRDALNRFHDKRLGLRLDGGDEITVFSQDPDFAPTWRAYYDLDNSIRVGPSPRTPEEANARQEEWIRLNRELDAFRERQDLHFRRYDLDRVVRNRAEKRDRLGYISKRAQDGVRVICDSTGQEWSITDLNQAVAVRQQFLENTDPILKHIKFGTDVPALAKDLTRVAPFLKALLQDMLLKNDEVRNNVLADPKWAFEHSKIESSNLFHQSGLHAMANDALWGAFGKTSRYYWSMEHLYSHQLGWVSLRDTFLFVGITFLSIFCPPLGAALGLGEAIWRYREAKDLENYYGALLDPKDIISRAEVEAQMFVAKLGLALAFIPVAGEISSLATKAIKATVSQGLRTGMRAALRQAMEDLVEKMGKSLGVGMVKELAQMPVMMTVMEKILDPIVEDVIRQVEVALPVAVPEEETYIDPEDEV